MTFFARHWSTYRRVLDNDLMEHRALTAAVGKTIEAWLSRRDPRAPAPHLVDLGCGDLSLLPPLLRRLPLASFTGLDMNAAVLPLAAEALGPVPFPCRFLEGDLLAWAEAAPEPEQPPVDLLISSFAIHHLEGADKGRFLAGCRRRLAPGGLLLWADVFREPGESRDTYVARYSARVQGWEPLEPERRQEVIAHLSQWDHPAERELIEQEAQAAGWDWRWAWQGRHRAEALAVLRPG
ncbi:trans-aconitate 2-methyltransferase [Synechococcus sp. CCY 9618]|uniref:class I SAM-dependent methyltransferase n=1 Tax=Synechococcus sp. CCY 9618 TaxID=2815602 RepID=UPI001C223B4E|nr:class I SAM-dependent methyltransferase [Synechococcus sp. CCY 9618]